MNRLKKLFGEVNMTWGKVLILAIATAVFAALLNCIPILERTSLSTPAESFEFWILCAIFIIFNCHGYREAALKTFVFFLVSQPLIYLIEVPFKEKGFGLFEYYLPWFKITLLTVPGAMIAYRAKKDDVVAAIIMSVAIVLNLVCGLSRLNVLITEFPRYLLTMIFCVVTSGVYIFAAQKENKFKWITSGAGILTIAVMLGIYVFTPSGSSMSYPLPEEGWQVVSVSDSNLIASVEGDSLHLESSKSGVYEVTFENAEGESVIYQIDFDSHTGLFDVYPQ